MVAFHLAPQIVAVVEAANLLQGILVTATAATTLLTAEVPLETVGETIQARDVMAAILQETRTAPSFARATEDAIWQKVTTSHVTAGIMSFLRMTKVRTPSIRPRLR